jgi:hypothetical protein
MDCENRATLPDTARDLPDNKSLLTAFKAAVERSPAPRNRFYERMALTVGATALMALQDTIEGRARMHVLSAPAGSGKTTLTNAFIEAMIEVIPLASCCAAWATNPRKHKRMTPGRCAEGVRVATASGSFGLTVRGVRETPSVRSELSKRLTLAGQRAQLLGPNQRAAMLARSRQRSARSHITHTHRPVGPSVRDVREM